MPSVMKSVSIPGQSKTFFGVRMMVCAHECVPSVSPNRKKSLRTGRTGLAVEAAQTFDSHGCSRQGSHVGSAEAVELAW